jgi:hypothetical protein
MNRGKRPNAITDVAVAFWRTSTDVLAGNSGRSIKTRKLTSDAPVSTTSGRIRHIKRSNGNAAARARPAPSGCTLTQVGKDSPL